MHVSPVRPSCVTPQQLRRELGHFQVGKWAVLVLCVCFPLGSTETAFIRMALCLHGLIPAGSVLGGMLMMRLMTGTADCTWSISTGCRWSRNVLLQEQQWHRSTKAASFDGDVRSLDTSAGELLPFLSQPSGKTWWAVSRGEQIPG